MTHLSIPVDKEFRYPRPAGEVQAMFFGTGSDGTVGANKNTVKIIGEGSDLYAQGYFVYDSKKAGSVTVSHLRFGPNPIRSSYLIERADFVACHRFGLLGKLMVLGHARDGATFLLNSPFPADEVWDNLPECVQVELIEKHLRFWVIDADRVAAEAGMGNRINTVMQPCFFALSGVLPVDDAVARIKESVEKTYGKRGPVIVERNFAAIDRSLQELTEVKVPESVTCSASPLVTVPDDAPDFVKQVTVPLLAGEGDQLPVSAFPVDGSYITGTAKYEKRVIARQLPVWDPELCIDCGKCALVCPHGVIRMKVYEPGCLEDAPEGFRSKDFRAKELPGHRDDHPALARRLHRLRRVRQRLSRQEQDRGEAPRHQHGARSGAPRGGARQLAILRRDTAARPGPAAPRLGARLTGARTAVRVLRRLRGLR